MASIINATTTGGLVTSADNSGILQLQSGGVTKATISSSGFSYTGAVLQVVQSVYSGSSVSTASTTLTTTGISGSITPTSSSSKVLVLVNSNVYQANTGTGGMYTIYRGSTNLAAGTSPSIMGGPYNGAGTVGNTLSMNFLDSPATTSSTTYTVYFATSGGTTYFNFVNGNANSTITTITLLEIAA